MSGHRGPAVLALALFVILAAAARSLDVPRAGYGIKSDEATYVAMTLSLVHDRNLSYERQDLERFAGIYHQGPDGIFLKRGKRRGLDLNTTFPFVRLTKSDDPNTSRLYFGKAMVYPLLAAPFVGLWGLNGMLVLHVVLFLAVGVCGYAFLVTQSPPAAAAAFTTAFLGAAAVPVYGVFLMPEIFNFSAVFIAYFLWVYKEVSGKTGRLAGGWTDIAAAVLLGIATYSKPLPVAVLVAPLVVLAWTRRQWGRGVLLGVVAVASAAAFFGLTAAISGEFNYQGGDRKTFYGRYPYDAPESTWDRFPTSATTDGVAARDVVTSPDAPRWLARNIKYFLVGRHFGFLPYYFPGALAIGLWLASRARRDTWRSLTFAAFVASMLGLLIVLPFTWSGGGGPPGNRYALSAYPVLFFLAPPMASALPGLAAWIVGALFTAKMLVNPFAAAKFTWEIYERGLARRLPVELTMSQDLPVMLAQPLRARVQYGHEAFLFLYFLDQNAFPPEVPPEPYGMWISGAGRADIIVRSREPLRALAFEAESRIATNVSVSLGGETAGARVEPGTIVRFEVAAPAGVIGRYGEYVYLMHTTSSEGFVPRVFDPQSSDYRNLGALLRFRPLIASSGTP